MREITSDQVYGDHSAVIANLIDNGVKIDYFSLLRGDKNVLKSVTVENIEPVAKALALIPDLEVGRLMPADAYLFLANMEFNKRGKEKGNWADACAKYDFYYKIFFLVTQNTSFIFWSHKNF